MNWLNNASTNIKIWLQQLAIFCDVVLRGNEVVFLHEEHGLVGGEVGDEVLKVLLDYLDRQLLNYRN